ncbi:MAG: DUF4115 domain-containing protein [Aestuariivita sp.]|nr:DUF4115 domain-containing protein [Aestuariivita sp.]
MKKVEKLRGFDDYELKLGDIMRGERATMGKSLLDVQRELCINPRYIEAIETSNLSEFDSMGFVSGYVRSYARYLKLDPEEAYQRFCEESGFIPIHSDQSLKSKFERGAALIGEKTTGKFFHQKKHQMPKNFPIGETKDDGFQISFRAIGSIFILACLVLGIGYGGWFVLQEIQRVQVAPVEQVPFLLLDIDPINPEAKTDTPHTPKPMLEAFDRLRRPQVLDFPRVVARDGPISTLDPDHIGVFAESTQLPALETIFFAEEVQRPEKTRTDAVPSESPLQLQLVVVRPAWVRINSSSGEELFKGIFKPGERYVVPADIEAPAARIGESGSVYFEISGKYYGPVGKRGKVTPNLILSPDKIIDSFDLADLNADSDLKQLIERQQSQNISPVENVSNSSIAFNQSRSVSQSAFLPSLVEFPNPLPQVLENNEPKLRLVAARPAWIRVKASNRSIIFEGTLDSGEIYTVPETEGPPTLRVGDSGAVYFSIRDKFYGPIGPSGKVTSNIVLSVQSIMQNMVVADLENDEDLARLVVEAKVVESVR